MSNHHLGERAGSELYVSELVGALRSAGHDARVFTLLPGQVSKELEASGVPVYTSGQAREVVGFQPEVVHAHHGPTLWWLGAHLDDVPVIYSSLGVLPPHEAPPAAWPGVAQGVAVSEEVLARLASSPFGRTVPLTVMRNWFDDRGWTPAPAAPPARVRQVAVVSNHLAPDVRASLDALAAAGRLEWTHYGLPANSRDVTPALLEPFDLIVTIGRTALLAAALGRPCLLWDVHGCDGLMEVERLPAQSSVNFSGRLSRARPTVEQLEALLDRAAELDVASLQRAVLDGYRLTDRSRDWVSLYRRVLAGPVRLDRESRAVYRPMAELYTDALLGAEHARVQVAERDGRCVALASDVEALRASLAAGDDEARRLRVQLEAEQTQHAATEARLAELAAELEVKRGEFEAKRGEFEAKRDDAIRERDDALRERDDALRGCDDAIRGCDDAIRERDDALRGCDELRESERLTVARIHEVEAQVRALQSTAGMRTIALLKRIPGLHAAWMRLKRHLG